MLKLSYIIPTYNASAYIRQTLGGIFALPLSMDKLEVIVIDDCSTDDTLAKLQKMQTKHPNLVVLRQERNQRQGAARNRGIDMARGEYIAFCDADDNIVPDGVMNALKAVQESNVDLCYFDFEYGRSGYIWRRFEMPEATRNTILSAADYLNNYYTCAYNAPWRCLYRTEFLQKTGIRFVEGARWEDCDWTVKVYAKANKIQFVDGVGYRYGQSENNTCSQSKTPQAIGEQLFAGLRLLEFANEVEAQLPGLAETLKNEAINRYVGIMKLRNLTRLPISTVRQMYNELNPDVFKQLKTYKFSPWVNLSLRCKCCTLFCLCICTPIAQFIRNQMHKHKQQP